MITTYLYEKNYFSKLSSHFYFVSLPCDCFCLRRAVITRVWKLKNSVKTSSTVDYGRLD